MEHSETFDSVASVAPASRGATLATGLAERKTGSVLLLEGRPARPRLLPASLERLDEPGYFT
ncbi:hypothetical protein RM96_08005 [Cupriavidus sp. IDO]|nr:hypothetical protein RM96_08005 [Cupriavidus sp. IDO]